MAEKITTDAEFKHIGNPEQKSYKYGQSLAFRGHLQRQKLTRSLVHVLLHTSNYIFIFQTFVSREH